MGGQKKPEEHTLQCVSGKGRSRWVSATAYKHHAFFLPFWIYRKLYLLCCLSCFPPEDPEALQKRTKELRLSTVPGNECWHLPQPHGSSTAQGSLNLGSLQFLDVNLLSEEIQWFQSTFPPQNIILRWSMAGTGMASVKLHCLEAQGHVPWCCGWVYLS